MLSYQHEYHAGNTGDILKHTALCLILSSLCKKEKPFTIIDTHAGAGRFDLNDERLLKTGEGKEGILKLKEFCDQNQKSASEHYNLPYGVQLYMEKESPYLKQNLYAGSSELERIFLREKDTLHLTELHPGAFASLEKNTTLPVLEEDKVRNCAGKIFLHKEDSYKSLVSLTPPLVKRGLILCDPSYEDKSDYAQVTDALKAAHKKWNTAVIALWYPLISRRKNETAQMLASLEDAAKLGNNPCESFNVELITKNLAELTEESGPHMYGSGMFIMNPPWLLEEQIKEAAEFYGKVVG